MDNIELPSKITDITRLNVYMTLMSNYNDLMHIKYNSNIQTAVRKALWDKIDRVDEEIFKLLQKEKVT